MPWDVGCGIGIGLTGPRGGGSVVVRAVAWGEECSVWEGRGVGMRSS